MTKMLLQKSRYMLAEEHWAWINSLLEIQREAHKKLEEKLFKDAFIHGYKHGCENIEEKYKLEKKDAGTK